MSTQEATGLFPAPARLVGERTGKRIHTFRYAGIKSAALTVAGSEHLGLPEVFHQLDSDNVCMGWFGRWRRPSVRRP